jgi:hypothetical protein
MKSNMRCILAVGQLVYLTATLSAQNPTPLGDYVPCKFTGWQDANFRGKKTEEQVFKKEASKQVELGRLKKDDLDKYIELFREVVPSSAAELGGLRTFSSTDFIAGFDASRTKRLGALINPGTHDANDKPSAINSAKEGMFSSLENAFTAPLVPKGIGCSQSLLSWEETNAIFGRLVADTYLAFQVVVRNTSPDNEFVLHDVQIALDDPWSRFVAGRDKVLVRGVALRGQTDDPRNVGVRLAEAIGGLVAAASVAFSSVDFKNGVSIFHSGFLPGLKSVFPDNTIQQLERLSDLGFSSASAYKIVISKSGSAPFVTFLPAKIFADREAKATNSGNASGTQKKQKSSSKAWGYKGWSQEKLLAFSNSAFVIVAGVHVKEVDETPSVATLACQGINGAIDLAKVKVGDKVACDITGKNLDRILKLSLRSTQNSGGPAADGPITVGAKDTTSGKITLSGTDLLALHDASYEVYIVRDASDALPSGLTVTIKQPAQQ